ncbi:MAG: hypothetical protein Q9199_003413 [Rusavskia elegans]
MSTPEPTQNKTPRLNFLSVAIKLLPPIPSSLLSNPKIQEITNQPDASTIPQLTEWSLEEIRRWRVGCEDLIYRLSKQEQQLARSEMSTGAVGSKGDSKRVFFEEMRKMEGMAREWHGQLDRLRTVVNDMSAVMGRDGRV